MKNTKKKNGAAAKGKGRATLSTQQTIPYLSMHPDGVCKLPGGLYTKTVEYEDINYSVASTEDQTAIFSGWSSFLNSFDSSLPFQLSFINRRSHSRSRYQVNIPKADDNYNSVRDEFTGMLKNQIAKSNNGIERSKYITFGIPAEGIAEARPRLERVEADVMGNFKRLGVPSEPMDGRARLALLQPDASGEPRGVPLFVERHPADRARHKRLYCPGQSRLPPVPHIPYRPVLGRGVLLADYGIGAFG